jgi:acyl-CoA synthetase (AMP-forming)/AMP-acid ligase II
MVSANRSGNRAKRGSIGTPVGAEIKLMGEPVALMNCEADGELLVRGPAMFEGYCNPWRPREEFSVDGWFRTGDLAKRDRDGFYWIIGRLKEMINVGGLKVVPAEVEDVLTAHPDVEEAVVFGVADARFGEVPHAKVKLVAGSRVNQADILRYARQNVAFYKLPRSIEIVAHLSQTASGKIKRDSLR